jgi:hypothetical protein
MPRAAAFVVLVALAHAAQAGEPDARGAIDRGLKFLAEDAVAWKADRKCSSCHHAPMAIWTLNEAKRGGYAVEDKALAELNAWVLAKDDPAKVSPKQPDRKDVFVNQTPLMLALAFETGDPKDPATRDGLKAMLAMVLGDQDKDGAWRLGFVWEPHGSTPDVMTTWALLAITDPNAPDLGAGGKAARERGLKWLAAAAPADTPQADGLRLVLTKRLGRPPAEREPLLKSLLARQNPDGGWGQAAGMKSDAFATGQALVAVAEAGRRADDPAVARARRFLVNSQRADGSWEMASRPGGPGGKSAKNLAPITLVGTAWAVRGLIHSEPAGAASDGVAPPRPK